MYQLDLNFTVASNTTGPTEYSRICVHYVPDRQEMSDVASILPTAVMAGNPSDKNFLRLDPAEKRSKPFNKVFQSGLLAHDKILYKAWTRERLDLMLGFANWMIMLWDTPWTSQPCTCGIRFEQLNHSIRRYTLSREQLHACQEQADAEYKLLKFGTSEGLGLTRTLQLLSSIEGDILLQRCKCGKQTAMGSGRMFPGNSFFKKYSNAHSQWS
ncbi:hypothetical protein SLS54_008101 [Diplodia seriata]